MSSPGVDCAIRFGQHVLAAGFAYLAFCALFFWYESPYPRWNMFWALSMTYASIVVVPPAKSLKTTVASMVVVFFVVGGLSPLLFTSWKRFSWDVAAVSSMISVLNPGSLLFVAVYSAVVLVVQKAVRR